MTSMMDRPEASSPPPGNTGTSRHRHTLSDPSRRSTPTKPVDEAVTTALDEARKESSSSIPPELVAQITEKVIKQLQESGLEPSTSHPSSPPPPSNTIHHPTPHTPSTTASGTSQGLPDRVLTPPSPEKRNDYSSRISPPLRKEHATDGTKSPAKEPATDHGPLRRPHSPYTYVSDANENHSSSRPAGPPRLASAEEETTLERIWGKLFDQEGKGTVRLGQLLRGLAVHIIEDYHPKQSLVVTPDKMVKYYEDTKLANEVYPWGTVFDDEQTSISRMYRDLKCQHHLVQEKFEQRPDIPGLTPHGFERWVTLLIRAHPEAEFERLQKTILEMPINNPDDKKERFPKEISRRLFPGHEDWKIREMIEDSISEHAAIDLPRRGSHESLHSHPEPVVHQPHPPSETTSAPANHRASVSFAETTSHFAPSATYQTPALERERKPYSNVPAECAVDDTNPPPPPSANSQPNPIERERKPYTAQPGGGKQYGDDPYRPTPVTTSSSANRDGSRPRAESVLSTSNQRPTRADSSARSRPISIAQSRPIEIPKPEVHHNRAPSNTGSITSGSGVGRRRRSPSFSRGSTNDFRKSEPEVRNYASNYDPHTVLTSRSGAEPVLDESDTRRYFDRQARERAERARREDEARNLGETPRRSYEPPGGSTGRRNTEYPPSDDEYHRSTNGGRGYDYQQPYGGPVYR